MAPFTPNSSVTSKRRSKSNRAGVILPVSRIDKYLRMRRITRRVGPKPALYLTAVVEYLVCEIFELAANVTIEHKKNRITPRHILMAVRQDEELDSLLRRVTMGNAGVLPNIHSQLLPAKTTVGKTNHSSSPSQEY